MTEKDIENLIARHPEDFFKNEGFVLVGQQVSLGTKRADIVFKDKHKRTIIVEVKKGILSREASGQIIEYYGLMKQTSPESNVELILCANIVPAERKIFLENVGIECLELGIAYLVNIARKYGYQFLDELDRNQIDLPLNIQKPPNNLPVALSAQTNCWIFQANPRRFDILNCLADSFLRYWEINQHKSEVKIGDVVLLWMSGTEAGIYALAEVVSNPEFFYTSPEEDKYWVESQDRGKNRLLVRLKLLKDLTNAPLLKSELRKYETLKNLSILRFSQGTNFPVKKDEWELIRGLIG